MPITKICIRCNKNYTVPPVRKESKYCSFDCYKRNLRIKKICQICNKEFTVRPCLNIAKFCSHKCYAIYRTGKKLPPFSEEHRQRISIAQKGRPGYWMGKKRLPFSSKWRNNMSISRLGNKNPKWIGGRRYDGGGYVLVYSPNHPNKTIANAVYEHRLVMEKHLKRFLKPKEQIHHINGIKDDNRLENLMLFANASEHTKHHFSH